jgi:hypothetical protein
MNAWGLSIFCHSFLSLSFNFKFPGALRHSPVWVPGANVQMGLSQCQQCKHKLELTTQCPSGIERMMERWWWCHCQTYFMCDELGNPLLMEWESFLQNPSNFGCRNYLHNSTFVKLVSADFQNCHTHVCYP